MQCKRSVRLRGWEVCLLWLKVLSSSSCCQQLSESSLPDLPLLSSHFYTFYPSLSCAPSQACKKGVFPVAVRPFLKGSPVIKLGCRPRDGSERKTEKERLTYSPDWTRLKEFTPPCHNQHTGMNTYMNTYSYRSQSWSRPAIGLPQTSPITQGEQKGNRYKQDLIAGYVWKG